MFENDLGLASLPTWDKLRPRTVTDQIFDVLYGRVVDLTLPPGARLSEAEVAAQLGVSRQPVRDAFYRLSQLGFIEIRPQRATTVTALSEEGVLRASFIRTALEEACIRKAVEVLTDEHLSSLSELIDRQALAVEADRREEFHALDDQFHRDICDYAGVEFVWKLIKENKGHMDRARYLSLAYSAPTALADHRDILAALRGRDPATATAAIRLHLSRIAGILERLRRDQPEMFRS